MKDAVYKRNGNLLKKNEYVKAVDNYIWNWHNWHGQEEGKIIEANGKDHLKFSFVESCEVEVTMDQRDTAILLSLYHSNILVDQKSKLQIFYGCSNGRTFWLTNLKAYLEHGILLNKTEIDLRSFDLADYEFINM